MEHQTHEGGVEGRFLKAGPLTIFDLESDIRMPGMLLCNCQHSLREIGCGDVVRLGSQHSV